MDLDCRTNRRNFLAMLLLLAAGSLEFPAVREVLGLAIEDDGDSGYAVQAANSGAVPLIYSARYNISAFGLEHLHPFDACKFAKIRHHLIESGLRGSGDFVRPHMLTRSQLLKIHTPEYLESLKSSKVLAEIFEVSPLRMVPSSLLDWRVLTPMRLAGGGTNQACRLALEHGLAINIGGGYHHADRDHGGGFCVYSDVPIALTMLQQEGKIRSALIVDTDAHQGNGFANVLRQTGWGHVVDLFDESIYPYPKVQEDMSIPLPQATTGDAYLQALEQAVPEALSRFKPDLIVYNAGSDVLKTDPLSSLQVAPEELCQRDLFVVTQAREKNIPLAMVLAGGYGVDSASAHARSIEGIVSKYDRKNRAHS